MDDILLMFHFLGLGAGFTGGIANGLLVRQLRGSPGDAPVISRLQPIFGRVGQVGLGILWVTGPWMLFTKWAGGAGLGWTFYVKILFVVAVTAGVILIDMSGRQARAGDAAARARMPMLGAGTGLMLLLVVVFAVLTFH